MPALAITSRHNARGMSMFFVEKGSIAGAMKATCIGCKPGTANSSREHDRVVVVHERQQELSDFHVRR